MRRTAKPNSSPDKNAKKLPPADLLLVAEAVKLRAAREGSIDVGIVRAELERAGSDAEGWPQIIQMASTHLVHRDGRFFYVEPCAHDSNCQEKRQHAIQQAVHRLVDQFRLLVEQNERREASRMQFIQPVTVVIDGHVTHRALTKDISPLGIRLIGTRGLLGQKVQIDVPSPSGGMVIFLARVVWTCEVGDGLYENGGVLLDVVRH